MRRFDERKGDVQRATANRGMGDCGLSRGEWLAGLFPAG